MKRDIWKLILEELKVILKEIKIRNFAGLNHIELKDLGVFNIIYGKNKTGKTSLLSLLTNFNKDQAPTGKGKDKQLWISNKKIQKTKSEDKIEESLVLKWELNKEDILKVGPYCMDFFKIYEKDPNVKYLMVFEHIGTKSRDIKFYLAEDPKKILGNHGNMNYDQYEINVCESKIPILIPDIRFKLDNIENEVTPLSLERSKESPETLFTKDQKTLNVKFFFNWLYHEREKDKSVFKGFISIVENLINIKISIKRIPKINYEISFNYSEDFVDFEAAFLNLGHGSQQLLIILFFCYFLKDRLILIDELEIGLHPSLQRKLYDELFKLAEYNDNQIIATSHSPYFLEICENIYLLKRSYFGINSHSSNLIKLEVIDELENPNLSETADIISKFVNDIVKFKEFDYLDLKMIKNLSNYYQSIDISLDYEKGNKSFKDILDLGTYVENPNIRKLQNAFFLTKKIDKISLCNTKGEENISKQRKIIICELNKLDDAEREQLKKEIYNKTSNVKKRWEKIQREKYKLLCEKCWDSEKFQKEKVLTYLTKEDEKLLEIRGILKKIKKKLNSQTNYLIVFPENTVPYCAIDELINFATEYRVVIIAGMEHKLVNVILDKIEELNHKYPNRFEKIDYAKIFRKLYLNFTELRSRLKIRIDKILKTGRKDTKGKIEYDIEVYNRDEIDIFNDMIEYSALDDKIRKLIESSNVRFGREKYETLDEFYKNEYPEIYELIKNQEKIAAKSEDYKYKIAFSRFFARDLYLNQAIIINSNEKFSFQIKNIPVVMFDKEKGVYITEGIPSFLESNIKSFRTNFGTIAVFICKDFLVNHEVIPMWMEKNGIKTIVVPSFTVLTQPFRAKFGEIVRKKRNRDKYFVFASLAEYNDSAFYYHGNRNTFESGGFKNMNQIGDLLIFEIE